MVEFHSRNHTVEFSVETSVVTYSRNLFSETHKSEHTLSFLPKEQQFKRFRVNLKETNYCTCLEVSLDVLTTL